MLSHIGREAAKALPTGAISSWTGDGRTQKSFSCNPDGSCHRITSSFGDDVSRHMKRVEWRDPSGVLRMAFDYAYQLDQFDNWTKRTVWVWSPELGERKLAEIDYQTLTYWNK